MRKFQVYSRTELVEKVEALERLNSALEKSNRELQQYIKIFNYSRDMDQQTINELVEQRNELIECLKAHEKIYEATHGQSYTPVNLQ